MRFLILLLMAAQAPLSFESASVKLNKSGAWRRQIGPAPGGRFTATNVPARELIAFAYGIPQDSTTIRVLGAPKWLDDERFDVNANVTGTWTPDQMREMMRTLLADRFTLVAHRETREMPTYALVVSSDNRPHLRRSQVDRAACEARRAAIQRREPVPPPVPGAPPVCGTGRTNPGTITAIGFPLDSLASSLGQFVSRLVTNRTGLEGLWDLDLTWTPDQLPQLPPDAPPLSVDPNGPSLLKAIEEQLGFKLQPKKMPLPVLVVDHIEPLTEN